MNVWFVLCTDDGLDGGTAEQLSASMAKAAPELKQCVTSCKHIAETARQQSNFQNVSSTFLHLLRFKSTSVIISNFFLTPGEWRVVPGRPGDWQGLLYCRGAGVFHRHNWDLPDGPFQPASFFTFPWRSQEVSPSNEQSHWSNWEWGLSRFPGMNQVKISRFYPFNGSGNLTASVCDLSLMTQRGWRRHSCVYLHLVMWVCGLSQSEICLLMVIKDSLHSCCVIHDAAHWYQLWLIVEVENVLRKMLYKKKDFLSSSCYQFSVCCKFYFFTCCWKKTIWDICWSHL